MSIFRRSKPGDPTDDYRADLEKRVQAAEKTSMEWTLAPGSVLEVPMGSTFHTGTGITVSESGLYWEEKKI